MAEHHPTDSPVYAETYRCDPPDRLAERRPFPLEVRSIGGLGLVHKLEPVIEPGRLPDRVPDDQLSTREQCAWRFAHGLTAERDIEQSLYDEAAKNCSEPTGSATWSI